MDGRTDRQTDKQGFTSAYRLRIPVRTKDAISIPLPLCSQVLSSEPGIALVPILVKART